MEKFNFNEPESALSEEEVLAAEKAKTAKPAKRYGVLERLYKSKSARAVAFVAALFGAGIGLESGGLTSERDETAISEAVGKDELKLESLAGKFKTEVQIPGGEKTILHIGQEHGANYLEEMPEEMRAQVIKSQKSVENLLSVLKSEGVSDTVYAENEDVANIDMVDSLIKKRADSPGAIGGLYELTKTVEGMPGESLSDKQKAHFLYSIKCELDDRIKKESAKLSSEDKMKALNMEYELESDELINGDNIYLWGAAFKMKAEKKINMKAAETVEANKAVYSAEPTTLEKLIYSPKGMIKNRQIARERAAVEIIGRDLAEEKERVIPLVYGEGHNFKESVSDFNKKTGQNRFGLTKITPAEAGK